jgi:hypothetical protein
MKLWKSILTLMGALVLCAIVVQAQNQQDPKGDPRSVRPVSPPSPSSTGASTGFGKTPVPAARGVSTAYDPQPYDPAQVEPDTNTLSGAELFGLGSLEHSRNIFDPSLFFTGLGQTTATGSGGQSTLQESALLGGSLNFNRTWSRYQLTATYNGGETFSRGTQNNGAFHNAAVAQEIEWERWRLHLRDDFQAAPGTTFTGSGMGGPGLIGEFSSMLGTSLGGIAQGFAPSDTIQTGQAIRYLNMTLGEVEYSFSRRSALTFSGSYGLLHFTGAGYIDSRSFNTQAGYDYLLDPKNSIAILASYGKIDYAGVAASTKDYTVTFAYGRKISGRLAFQAVVGSDQICSVGTGNGNFQSLTWTIRSALSYELRRTGYTLSYARGLTGGSGVLLGAMGNTFTGSLHHQFTRAWSGSARGGYAFNRSLAPAGGPTTSFTNWFIGANVDRRLGHHAQLGLDYGVQEQNSPAVCPVTSCGATGLQQSFGVTVSWHLHPVG